jgi:hypothetical protein
VYIYVVASRDIELCVNLAEYMNTVT